jgi:hypothetical protein
MHRLLENRHAAEAQVQEVPEVLVVIAGNVDELGSLAGLAQQLLDHVVVELVPVPRLAQRPVVDEVADDVELVGLGLRRKSSSAPVCARFVPRCMSEMKIAR